MKKQKFSKRLYLLVRLAVKIEGTYDPDVILPQIGYKLGGDEYVMVRAFLAWLHHEELSFDLGNYKALFREWKGTHITGEAWERSDEMHAANVQEGADDSDDPLSVLNGEAEELSRLGDPSQFPNPARVKVSDDEFQVTGLHSSVEEADQERERTAKEREEGTNTGLLPPFTVEGALKDIIKMCTPIPGMGSVYVPKTCIAEGRAALKRAEEGGGQVDRVEREAYEERVRALENEGMSTSDAQAVIGAEDEVAGFQAMPDPRPMIEWLKAMERSAKAAMAAVHKALSPAEEGERAARADDVVREIDAGRLDGELLRITNAATMRYAEVMDDLEEEERSGAMTEAAKEARKENEAENEAFRFADFFAHLRGQFPVLSHGGQFAFAHKNASDERLGSTENPANALLFLERVEGVRTVVVTCGGSSEVYLTAGAFHALAEPFRGLK